MTTEDGEYHLASFIDEQKMHRLYEKFILEYYAQEFAQHVKVFLPERRKFLGIWMMATSVFCRTCRRILRFHMVTRF